MAYESTTFDPETTSGRLKERAQNAMQQVRARGSETFEDSVDWVRRHPGSTVAASVILGSVAGALVANAIGEAARPATRWEQIQSFGEGALEKLKDGACAALSAGRDLMDKAASKLRS